MWTLYEGDCLEVMADLPSDSVDIVITSPPYNLGNNHHTGNNRHNPYDDNLPEDEYQHNQRMVLGEIYRVLKDDGSLFYNHKNRIKKGVQISPYEWLLQTEFYIKQELVWFNGSQNFDKIRFYPMTERVYWLTKSPKTKLFNSINHHDVFTREDWPVEGTSKQHKRAFPVKMVEDILSCFPEAKTALDPYAGSGTVGVACEQLNRNSILIEMEPEYCELIRERMKNATSQTRLMDYGEKATSL